MEKVAGNCGPEKAVYDGDGLNTVRFHSGSPALLIIKVTDSRFSRIMSRWVFLAMFLLALPLLCAMMNALSHDYPSKPNGDSQGDNGFKSLPVILRHFLNEGLIKEGHNGVIFEADMRHTEHDDLGFLRDAGIELFTGAELHSVKVAAHVVFDFVLTTNFDMVQQIDGIVKDNGLFIFPLGNDPLDEQRLLEHYKIVYIRRFERTMIAMRKIRVSDTAKEEFSGITLKQKKIRVSDTAKEEFSGITLKQKKIRVSDTAKEEFRGITPKQKRAALKGLEGVFLEPPTHIEASRSFPFLSRKIKFLPDLLKDPLDEYPRRIFIFDDTTSLDWFYKHYPRRGQEFEVYSIDQAGQQQMGVSTWLKSKVRSADFVVMKAEAQVVEEMLMEKSLHLVDELFLQCNNLWHDTGKGKASKRPYWQCVELYGKLTDEGIAVHQWWNKK